MFRTSSGFRSTCANIPLHQVAQQIQGVNDTAFTNFVDRLSSDLDSIVSMVTNEKESKGILATSKMVALHCVVLHQQKRLQEKLINQKVHLNHQDIRMIYGNCGVLTIQDTHCNPNFFWE